MCAAPPIRADCESWICVHGPNTCPGPYVKGSLYKITAINQHSDLHRPRGVTGPYLDPALLKWGQVQLAVNSKSEGVVTGSACEQTQPQYATAKF